MSLKVKISKEQLQAGRLIPNGPYSGVVTAIEEDTDKNGATMYIVEVKVTGNPEFEGVPIRAWMCAEWPVGGGDFLKRFIEALTGKPYTADQTVDLGAAKGINLKFFNVQGDYNGKPCNKIEDWKHKDASF